MTPFTIHQLHFHCEVRTPILLNPHKGSALRGALFHALRGEEGRGTGFCINQREQFCHRCPHHHGCPISILLATVDDDSLRGVDVPRPYTIEPPLGQQTVYQPGETLEFGLTLFANALDLFPYIIVGVRELERGGIGISRPEPGGRGYGRGRFQVKSIRAVNPLTGQQQSVLQHGDSLVTVPDVPITPAHVAAAAALAPSTDRVTLDYLTPVRLVDQGRLVHGPAFVPQMLRLFERLDALSHRFGSPILPDDRGPLYAAAERVTLVDDATRWVELESYSFRMRTKSPIGGFVGKATFAGPLATLLPWLLWGQFTHVGKDAVKGNGLYRVLW